VIFVVLVTTLDSMIFAFFGRECFPLAARDSCHVLHDDRLHKETLAEQHQRPFQEFQGRRFGILLAETPPDVRRLLFVP